MPPEGDEFAEVVDGDDLFFFEKFRFEVDLFVDAEPEATGGAEFFDVLRGGIVSIGLPEFADGNVLHFEEVGDFVDAELVFLFGLGGKFEDLEIFIIVSHHSKLL